MAVLNRLMGSLFIWENINYLSLSYPPLTLSLGVVVFVKWVRIGLWCLTPLSTNISVISWWSYIRWLYVIVIMETPRKPLNKYWCLVPHCNIVLNCFDPAKGTDQIAKATTTVFFSKFMIKNILIHVDKFLYVNMSLNTYNRK